MLPSSWILDIKMSQKMVYTSQVVLETTITMGLLIMIIQNGMQKELICLMKTAMASMR